jgi:hypothetical protein
VAGKKRARAEEFDALIAPALETAENTNQRLHERQLSELDIKKVRWAVELERERAPHLEGELTLKRDKMILDYNHDREKLLLSVQREREKEAHELKMMQLELVKMQLAKGHEISVSDLALIKGGTVESGGVRASASNMITDANSISLNDPPYV